MTVGGEEPYFARAIPRSVPEDWAITPVSVVCSFENGTNLPAEEREEGPVPVYGSNGVIDCHNEAVTRSPVIIVGRKGSAGAVNYCRSESFIVDTAYYVDGTTTKHNLRWLYYVLKALSLEEQSEDSAVPGMNRRLISSHKILLPSEKRQEDIAEFLDRRTARIDALVEKQKRLLDLLDEKRQTIITQAVTKGLDTTVATKPTDMEWLDEIPEHWDEVKLKWLLTESPKNGVSPPTTSKSEGIPTFSISTVRGSEIRVAEDVKYADIPKEDARRYRIDQGDVLLVRGNGSLEMVGKCGIVVPPIPNGCIYPDILIRLKFQPHLSTKYFVYLINSQVMRPQIEIGAKTSTGLWKVSQKTISNITVPYPPAHEQDEIVEHIDEVCGELDNLVEKTNDSIRLLAEKRQALITAAVTGQIDVTEKHGEIQDSLI